MNVAAAKLFAEGFLKGYCDVIGAMLSSAPEFDAGDPQVAASGEIHELLRETPLLIEAEVIGGGAVMVLTALEDARRITSAVMGDEPRHEPLLTPDETAVMKEIFDPCMSGGVSYFKEKFGTVIELQPAGIRLVSPEHTGDMLQSLGEAAILVPCSYNVPDIVNQGQAALLFSQTPEITVSAEQRGIDQEVEDIVQENFAEPGAVKGPSAAVSREVPGNINMILDISLTVTARLGRIEMPLGQVLELGPGSIIDVGHSVDEPVELLVNNKLIARGDVVVVEEKFGLRITEIISPTERIESLR